MLACLTVESTVGTFSPGLNQVACLLLEALPDHCGSTARPYDHRSSSPPRRRLLALRPLDSHLSLRTTRSHFLAADHRDENNTAQNGSVVTVLLPSLWGRLIRFFREHSHAELHCGKILKTKSSRRKSPTNTCANPILCYTATPPRQV